MNIPTGSPAASSSGSPSCGHLAMGPMVLLLDEITSALDPELVSEVLAIVRDLAAEGMTMLLATHEMGFAREVASKICFLYDGRVHEQGPPAEIFGAPREERTRAFLKRIIEAGRLCSPPLPSPLSRLARRFAAPGQFGDTTADNGEPPTAR